MNPEKDEILVGDDFDFPVHDVIPRNTEKEEKEGFYVRRRTVFDEKALSLEDE